jgi:NhaP-type Na+/H+ or K+/H+ antiporter
MQTSPSSPTTPITAPPDRNQGEAPERIPYWLQQAERFLRVIVRLYLGLLVCCAPWYPAAWDNNPLFASSPWLVAFISHGAVRGVVSGLGILNLWIAVREALGGSSSPRPR